MCVVHKENFDNYSNRLFSAPPDVMWIDSQAEKMELEADRYYIPTDEDLMWALGIESEDMLIDASQDDEEDDEVW